MHSINAHLLISSHLRHSFSSRAIYIFQAINANLLLGDRHIVANIREHGRSHKVALGAHPGAAGDAACALLLARFDVAEDLVELQVAYDGAIRGLFGKRIADHFLVCDGLQLGNVIIVGVLVNENARAARAVLALVGEHGAGRVFGSALNYNKEKLLKEFVRY